MNLPLLQDSTMFLPLVVKLGLEQSVLIPQLVVLRPVLLCFLRDKKKKHESDSQLQCDSGKEGVIRGKMATVSLKA